MLNYIVILLQLCGVVFFLGACIGILRMPDFYSRMHAASKGDTLSSLCLLGGFIIYIFSDLNHHSSLTAIKIIFILIFIFTSSPAASHALTDAAYKTGADPWSEEVEHENSEETNEEQKL